MLERFYHLIKSEQTSKDTNPVSWFAIIVRNSTFYMQE